MPSRPASRRPTISDVAAFVGVSKVTVSYALNDRPGVSPQTRARVLAAASQLGWQPNSAARALSGSGSGVVGLVLARPARTLGVEPFFMELIAGIEAELSARSYGLLLQVVADHEAETAVYRRWWGERRVDGVLLADIRSDDSRLDLVVELGLPTVLVGGPDVTGRVPAVWHDDRSVMEQVVEALAGLGHRRVGRVAGTPCYVHVQGRNDAFEAARRSTGLEASVIETDFSAEEGAEATRALLQATPPPTAILYDNDIMAVAGLGVTGELGMSVPGDVSLVAWDDSPLCTLVHPALSAARRDVPAFGSAAARQLLAVLGGGPVSDLEVPTARLVLRASTAPPPASAAAVAGRTLPLVPFDLQGAASRF